MSGTAKILVRVQEARFDVGDETRRLLDGVVDAGAIVAFTGLCRGENGRLEALELEHYPEMTEAEIGRIAREAADRWPVQAIGIVHRIGRISAGEEIVMAVAVSPHRAAAFNAAEFVMDFLKTEAPFWKKEHPVGESPTRWVEAKDSDDSAALRWRRKDAAE